MITNAAEDCRACGAAWNEPHRPGCYWSNVHETITPTPPPPAGTQRAGDEPDMSREVVVRLMDNDDDPLVVHLPYPECAIGEPHRNCNVYHRRPAQAGVGIPRLAGSPDVVRAQIAALRAEQLASAPVESAPVAGEPRCPNAADGYCYSPKSCADGCLRLRPDVLHGVPLAPREPAAEPLKGSARSRRSRRRQEALLSERDALRAELARAQERAEQAETHAADAEVHGAARVQIADMQIAALKQELESARTALADVLRRMDEVFYVRPETETTEPKAATSDGTDTP